METEVTELNVLSGVSDIPLDSEVFEVSEASEVSEDSEVS